MKLSIGLDRRAAAAWVFHWDGDSYYSIAACADPGRDGGNCSVLRGRMPLRPWIPAFAGMTVLWLSRVSREL